jgi:FAD synthase
LLDFLREEIKFLSKEELIMQINIDKTRALALKKEIKWLEIGLNLQ